MAFCLVFMYECLFTLHIKFHTFDLNKLKIHTERELSHISNCININCKYKTTWSSTNQISIVCHNFMQLHFLPFVSTLSSIFFEGDSTIEHYLEKTKKNLYTIMNIESNKFNWMSPDFQLGTQFVFPQIDHVFSIRYTSEEVIIFSLKWQNNWFINS